KERSNFYELVTQPGDVDWVALKRAGVLEQLKGCYIGKTTVLGLIFHPISGFTDVWPMQPGWDIRIFDAEVLSGQLRLRIMFRNGARKETRTFVLVWGKEIWRHKNGESTHRFVWELKSTKQIFSFLIAQSKDADWNKEEIKGLLEILKGTRLRNIDRVGRISF
ncbi:MAG: hypothetical protein HQL16_08340, partial [Candidatus Omnitrophica bacterium]|nr:hypothetical protein [Candidatus Omnitrophota bacterium]